MLGRSLIRRVGATIYQGFSLRSNTLAHATKHYHLCSRVPISFSENVCKPRYYSQQTTENMQTVDYEYVKKHTSNKNILIVDVREPDEVKEHGKIPHSINIPLGSVESILSKSEKEFQQMFQREKPKKYSEIIFYCMIGKRSGKAQQNALNMGYKNAKNYLGSWTDWAAKSQ